MLKNVYIHSEECCKIGRFTWPHHRTNRPRSVPKVYFIKLFILLTLKRNEMINKQLKEKCISKFADIPFQHIFPFECKCSTKHESSLFSGAQQQCWELLEQTASAVADLTCNYFRCHSLCYSADPFPPGTSRSAVEESKAEGENDK